MYAGRVKKYDKINEYRIPYLFQRAAVFFSACTSEGRHHCWIYSLGPLQRTQFVIQYKFTLSSEKRNYRTSEHARSKLTF